MINNTSLLLKSVTLQRGDKLLIENLSLKIVAGEVIELRGANGSGKTTLLRAIAGLHQPKAGVIEFAGYDEFENCDYVGIISHLDAIKSNDTIRSQLLFWAQLFGTQGSEISAIAQKLKISHIIDLMGAALSAGQKRRVAIARLLISHRPIWLLDEPFAPLDSDGRKILGQILKEHAQNGGIIIAAVHDDLPIENTRLLQLSENKVGPSQ